MEKIKCGTIRCPNVITHYHADDDIYYCDHCVLVQCNQDECKLLGSVASIKILIGLCRDLLDDIKDYASDQQLEMKWRLILEQLKQFENNLSSIKIDLENTIKNAKPKDLMKIQKRASDMKAQIKDSEVFSKYLVHKEMNKLRFRNTEVENELFLNKTMRIISAVKTEEEKIMIRNRLDNIRHLFEFEPAVNQELEDFKLKYNLEISDIKKTHKENIDKMVRKHNKKVDKLKEKQRNKEANNEKEKDVLLNKIAEIEQEFNKIKDQFKELGSNPQPISYDVKLI